MQIEHACSHTNTAFSSLSSSFSWIWSWLWSWVRMMRYTLLEYALSKRSNYIFAVNQMKYLESPLDWLLKVPVVTVLYSKIPCTDVTMCQAMGGWQLTTTPSYCWNFWFIHKQLLWCALHLFQVQKNLKETAKYEFTGFGVLMQKLKRRWFPKLMFSRVQHE